MSALARRRQLVTCMRIVGVALVMAWTGCDTRAGDPNGGANGALEGERITLPNEDPRYRVALAASPPAADAPGTLHVFVDLVHGWHVADEAPASLRLDEHETLTFHPAGGTAVRRHGEHSLEFESAFRASREGPATAQGRIKFGICADGGEQCVIIRQKLEMPLQIAHPL